MRSARVPRLLGLGLLTSVAIAAAACSFFGKTVETKVTSHPKAEEKPYIIGKDDVLDVIVWKEKELTGNVKVQNDGTITLPLAGKVPAEGLTTDQLQQDVHDRLAKFIKEPNVTVRVSDPQSRLVYIEGQVKRPGAYPMHSGEVLSQALAQAGGLTDYSDPSAIKIVRRTTDRDEQITVNYNRVLKGEIASDVALESHDTITVP